MKIARKFISLLAAASLSVSVLPAVSVSAGSDLTWAPSVEGETLNRGLTAVSIDGGIYLSWRLYADEDKFLGTSDENVSFNIYRGNELIATEDETTNYIDADGTSESVYCVAPVRSGEEGDKSESVTALSGGSNYIDIPLKLPADETITDSSGNSNTYSFAPSDCSTGDVDGDGELEIIVKFVSHELDVGNAGYSGTTRFNAYKLDGTRLWENDINLGQNVFSSAHTAQFLVYDFDGDGKAEMMCQTSLGSTDGAGVYTSHASSDATISAYTDDDNASADFRASGNGRVTTGDEFLTVFDGATGEALDTIDYPTARVSLISWGKNDGGNRCNRFLATVAYLDGEKPYAVYWRGYYDYGSGRTGIAGVSFDGASLSVDYQFDTYAGQPGYHSELEDYSGQGNHSMVAADVDGDGKDEFISGALCMEVDDNNELVPKWCSWREHGDAHHIGDYDPTNEGLEYFAVQEHGGTTSHNKTLDYGMTVYDAASGDELLHVGGSNDTGRGVMANVGAGGYYQVWSSRTAPYQSNGGTDFTEISAMEKASQNFRVFWDADLYDELLNGTDITSWNGSGMESIFTASGCTSVNSSKSNPSLQADLFGDWREEVVYPLSDYSALRVFTSTDKTDYKMKSLMYDRLYRMGVTAEQTCYNQPPHVGFYLADETFLAAATRITVSVSKTEYNQGEAFDKSGITVTAEREDGTTDEVTSYTISGYDPDTVGSQTLTVEYMGQTATFTITVLALDGIAITSAPTKTEYLPGESLDSDGLVVNAVRDGVTSSEISGYELSGYDPYTTGEQTITVSYLGYTASFTVTVLAPTGITIVSTPRNTQVYQNGQIDTMGLLIRASFSDGQTQDVFFGFTVTCDTSTIGTATATVTYYGQSATFEVEVIENLLASLYKTYETSSTTSVSEDITIGSYSGDCTLEHTVTINSMPASASPSKNDTSGFFMRFMSRSGTGAGWQIMNDPREGTYNFWWKTGGNFPTMLTQSGIEVGKTYTFKYEFTGLGSSGATVTLTITDEDGTEVGKGENLDLRNLSSNSQALTYIQIWNQASSEDTPASVTIGSTETNGVENKIVSVDDDGVITYSAESGANIYAAKYDDSGVLTNASMLEVETDTSSAEYTPGFVPSKVFIWNGEMLPLLTTAWESSAN